MHAHSWYAVTLAVLLAAGLIPAVAFIGQHRPRQWRRLAAWDASGFVIVAALIYARNLVLLVSRWPGVPPRSTGDAVFGIVSLVAIDALFVLRIVSWRSFAQRDAERRGLSRSD